MKSVNAAVSTALRNDYALYAVPRLLAEWNMNRFVDVVADNIPADTDEFYEAEAFPIESIIEPLRPTKGIGKVRINEAIVSEGYQDHLNARYYIGGDEDIYKYWTSPEPTDGTGTFPLHTDATTKVRPHIIYSKNISVNKIVVKVDNFFASPNSWTVKTQATSGGVWTNIATNPALANDGSLELYWTGSAWSATRPASFVNAPTTSIRGIMLQVNTMTTGKRMDGSNTTYTIKNAAGTGYTTVTTNGTNSFFNLIELGARLEVDLSDRLISVEDTFDMAEVSELYPVGTLTSNVANISLSNIWTDGAGLNQTGYFNRENVSGTYYGLLERNVKFNLQYIYTVSGIEYPVQQFELYGGPWQGLGSDEVSLELTDYSKFLEEIYPQPAMYEGLTVPEIIERMMDSIGYTKYVIDTDDRIEKHTIPVFWVDGEQNIWEVMDSLARGTQTAIYFDGFGMLQVKTRTAAYDDALSPTWTLRGANSGNELADIVSIDESDELGVNHVTVTYKTTAFSQFKNEKPVLTKVWEPEDVVTLRASNLQTAMTDASTKIAIPASDAKVWPYAGLVQIDAEIIKYEGKEYASYQSGSRALVIVKNADEFKEINEKTPDDLKHKNAFTGNLIIPVTDGSVLNSRGMWNSERKDHTVDASGYTVEKQVGGGTIKSGSSGFKFRKGESKVFLQGGGNQNTLVRATRGSAVAQGYYHYGTKMKFLKKSGLSVQQAGIMMHANTSNSNGYYIELTPTSKLGGKERKNRNELLIYSRTGNKWNVVGAKKGAAVGIAAGVEYEIDVHYNPGTNDILTVYINGKRELQATISGGDKIAWTGKFGMFVRGKTQVEYEYLYGVARFGTAPAEDSTFFNLEQGGYTGGFWDREWTWQWRTAVKRKKKKRVKYQQRWNQFYFDEFGPIVHEVREFNVKFDPKPVAWNRLYMSNTYSVICTEYRGTPFGAYFLLVNASRRNAVVHGEETLRFGEYAPGNRSLMAIGRVLVIADGKEIIAKNDASIKMRGKIESELESDWIQTEEMAQDIADWISAHWSQGVDQQNVTIFGNPLIEIGDVVGIEYPDKAMTTATHKYFVTGVATTFANGIETTLTLRRV